MTSSETNLTESHDSTADDFNQQLPIEKSKNFISKWNRLVSTTNWEKGNIVVGWRNALMQKNASPTQYSDEAWSRMVGDVTAQHVGRLRRTHERFGDSHVDYQGLYWSHFYAALDWDDAEMWLEGAVQNRWSVSRMRRQRWETLGKIPEQEPRAADVVVSEIDEGFQPLQFDREMSKSDRLGIAGPVYDDPDFGDEDHAPAGKRNQPESDGRVSTKPAVEPERLFENLADLPEDVAEAVESMKLAILRHKLGGWEAISQAQMLEVISALRKLAQSAADSEN